MNTTTHPQHNPHSHPHPRIPRSHAHPATALMQTVAAHGHLVRTSTLSLAGFSRFSVAQAISAGHLLRVRVGWVATRLAPQAGVLAVARGGKLTGSTALASRETWDADDLRLHILLPPKFNGRPRPLLTPISAFTAPRYPLRSVVLHWRNELLIDRQEPQWRASTVDALSVVARTAHYEQFIACVDSCLNSKTMSFAALPMLRIALPERLRSLLDHCEARAESGLESICRLRFVELGCRVQIQVTLPGIAPSGQAGSVDFILDGWLVIEVDGDEFHDPATDRIRNAKLVRLGYRWHRFGYHQVMNDWASVEATIRELLRYPPAR
ncbi:MAG: endonuclease domain-containing protein [Microbacteriaceae bacterium]